MRTVYLNVSNELQINTSNKMFSKSSNLVSNSLHMVSKSVSKLAKHTQCLIYYTIVNVLLKVYYNDLYTSRANPPDRKFPSSNLASNRTTCLAANSFDSKE
jgi:hypothetical protein